MKTTKEQILLTTTHRELIALDQKRWNSYQKLTQESYSFEKKRAKFKEIAKINKKRKSDM